MRLLALAENALSRRTFWHALLTHWRRNKLTTLMVTQDMEKVIYLSDRVVMMTYGPKAKVGDILDIPIEHQRIRADFLADSYYLECRNHLLTFLSERFHIRPNRIAALKSQ